MREDNARDEDDHDVEEDNNQNVENETNNKQEKVACKFEIYVLNKIKALFKMYRFIFLSLILVKLSLQETQDLKPIFETDIYNFSVSENAQPNSIIGIIKAKSNHTNSSIEYRIVPLVSAFDNNLVYSDSDFPININRITGELKLKISLDRELYYKNEQAIITFNIEASYDSSSYSYCTVNLIIDDVNDNAPVVNIKPITTFGDSKNSSLYVNENISTNQILAYIGIIDQDSKENGTIKSIDLIIKNYTKYSESELSKKISKLEQLKQLNDSTYQKLITKIQDEIEFSKSNFKIKSPIKLRKISEKMYALQLAENLKYSNVNLYEFELRVQDNGTLPQLETITNFQLNVIENNKYEPIFINNITTIEIIENQIKPNVIYKFVTIDLDSLDSVTYSFEDQTMYNIFSLDEKEGDLRQKVATNRSQMSTNSIELKVIAVDNSANRVLNSKFSLRIKIIDLNNNGPIFEQENNNLNFYFKFNSNASKKFLKISSFKLVDLDSFETNSVNYLTNKLNDTKIEIFKSSENLNQFKFADFECNEAFNYNIHTLNKTLPFVFVVENYESVYSVKCRISVWLDVIKFKLLKTNSFDSNFKFSLLVSDNGQPKRITNKQISIRIDLNNTNFLNYSKLISIFKINQDLKLEKVDQINSHNESYLLEYLTINEINGYKSFKESIQPSNQSNILVLYENKINKILENSGYQFKHNQDSTITYRQIKQFLIESKSLMTRSSNKITFFILIIVSLIILVLVVFLALGSRSKKLKIIKNLNVIDDISIENTKTTSELVSPNNLDYDKPENYSESNDEKFISPYSMIDLKSNYSKLYMLQKQNQFVNFQFENKASIQSGSSNYAESDEGCYGSSDLSSERELESKNVNCLSDAKCSLNKAYVVNNYFVNQNPAQINQYLLTQNTNVQHLDCSSLVSESYV
ncbi:unnamed protein product [Brachionus calyciflorus]|uniref:Cadherin domain-containing protein n=1 Tax=Brachionus calyciflorus TaxID=104777 RepID=A0A813XCR2_9BILA|nr:unnamed protein product [Brachionus calyciflorus]